MKVVLAHGVFDILHFGHLQYLEFAKRQGGYLIVSVTSDKHVNKGPDRPVFPLEKRMAMVKALRVVNQVVASHDALPNVIIRRIRPDVYVKGAEYRGKLPEQELVESLGGVVVFSDGVVHSSTALVGKLDRPMATLQ